MGMREDKSRADAVVVVEIVLLDVGVLPIDVVMSIEAPVCVGVRLPAGSVGDCAFEPDVTEPLDVVIDATDTAVGGDNRSPECCCCC